MFRSLNSSTLFTINNLHHAYLLVGRVETAERVLHDFFKSEGVELTGSPDYFLWKEPTFGIGEARELNATAVRKAFGARKIFFLAPGKLTLQAQNALLKTFEEPIENTHFFLVVREKELVIPTLLSRMQVVVVESEEYKELDAEKFLSLSIKDRMNFVKKFVDAEKNTSIFLDSLLTLLREENHSDILAKVYRQRLVSDQQGSSARLILEHLATVL